MDDTKEKIWKTCPKYSSIEASNFGRIRTKDRYVRNGKGVRLVKGCILKQHYDKDGYLYVSTSINGKKITLRAHRIIASAFIPNPNNYPEVNHIDCNRANNNVSNLEWCTSKYNSQYRDKMGHGVNNNPGKPVFAVDLRTGKVLRFESQSEASRQLGVSQGNICEALKGLYTQFKGYLFTEDESEITPQKYEKLETICIFWVA
ncbi:MAG: HNH endonuclease (endogenous virus) [Lactobacillus phage ViSo-2018a]|uniref:HNH homing endonuclease n=1 Tax=Lactobacillus phage ViSo-2018a TaxID=2267607 RepID=A0A3G6JHY5_9CAUD|nr:MAG: HNH endonuclease [Lactobacillus phage ViSo-2018a]AZA17346.1 MAG: HNH homing endonuclease [Lactobacillus phage ViSo-2018a]